MSRFKAPNKNDRNRGHRGRILRHNVKPRPSGLAQYEKPVPVELEAKRVGRNDPCPCGSGKKSKRCCRGVSAQDDNPARTGIFPRMTDRGPAVDVRWVDPGTGLIRQETYGA